jgi:hypothetical protein
LQRYSTISALPPPVSLPTPPPWVGLAKMEQEWTTLLPFLGPTLRQLVDAFEQLLALSGVPALVEMWLSDSLPSFLSPRTPSQRRRQRMSARPNTEILKPSWGSPPFVWPDVRSQMYWTFWFPLLSLASSRESRRPATSHSSNTLIFETPRSPVFSLAGRFLAHNTLQRHTYRDTQTINRGTRTHTLTDPQHTNLAGALRSSTWTPATART